MPDATHLHAESDEARRSRRETRRALDHLNDQAQAAEVFERNAKTATELLRELEQAHPRLAARHLAAAASSAVLVVVVVGVLVLDLTLFSPTAEYYARRAFPDSPILVGIARLALPSALLLVELTVATLLYWAREEREDTGRSLPYFGWLLMGASFVVVMPATVVATELADWPANLNAAGEASASSKLLVLVLIAFTGHAVVLFSGRMGHDSKVWLLFAARRFWLHRTVRRRERDHRRASMRAQRAYSRYLFLRESHNASNSDRPISAGPFTRATRDVLRALAGYDVIVLADPERATPSDDDAGPDSTPPPAGSPPPSAPAPAPAPAPEPDSSPQVDDTAVREADGEVRP